MNYFTTWETKQFLAFHNPRKNKPTRAVYRPIAALAPIRERHDPLDMRVRLANPPHRVADAPAFAVAWQPIGKRHAVQFDELIPKRARHEPLNLPLVERRSELHRTAAATVEEHAEVKLAVLHNLAGIVQRLHDAVRIGCRDGLYDEVFCASHRGTLGR
jgi:hypothetical protein